MCKRDLIKFLLLFGKYLTEDYMKELILSRLIQGLIIFDKTQLLGVEKQKQIENITNTLKTLGTEDKKWLNAILDIRVIESCLKFLENNLNSSDFYDSNVNIAKFTLWLYLKNRSEFMKYNKKIIESILTLNKLDGKPRLMNILLILLVLCLNDLYVGGIKLFEGNKIEKLKNKNFILLCTSMLKLFFSSLKCPDYIFFQVLIEASKKLSCLCVLYAFIGMDFADIRSISQQIEMFNFNDFTDYTSKLLENKLLKLDKDNCLESLIVTISLENKTSSDIDFIMNSKIKSVDVSFSENCSETKITENKNCEKLEFVSIKQPWDVPVDFQIRNGMIGMERDVILHIIYSRINSEDTRQVFLYIDI
jgi:hypothetical protein